MGRMHSGGKGISKSALPYKRTPPSWLKVTPTQVEENVCKLAKKGLTPSQVIIMIRVASKWNHVGNTDDSDKATEG